MTDTEMFKFIDDNRLDNIEGVISTLNSSFHDNESFRKNFYLIVFLTSSYYKDNNTTEKLEFLLSDIATINYLKDKDILDFMISLTNYDNRYNLTFEDEYKSFSLLINTCKAYLDTKRSNYKVLDNKYLSMIIDLYANYCTELNPIVKETFFLVLYNNYKSLLQDDLDYLEFALTKIYTDFISNPNFINHDTNNIEELYKDIEEYLSNYINILPKEKVK